MKHFKNFKSNFSLDSFNVPKNLCNHLIGTNHKERHRIVAGVIVMAIGVLFVKCSTLLASSIVHILGEMFGYLIHAVGALPILKKLEDTNHG